MTDFETLLARLANGRCDLVFDWTAAGRSPSERDAHGVSLLRHCAYYGDVSAIKHLVAAGASLDELGENLDLNGAVFHGHWRLCEYLLEQGADPNHALPDTQERPLHAALCKHEDPRAEHVVQVLLAAGARVDAATKAGVETGSFMRDCRTRGETALHRAAAFGTERSIRCLLEAGAKVDARDAHGDSPLSWASWALRPAFILDALCFGDERIHPEAVRASRQSRSGGSLASYLLGKPGA